MPRSTEDDHRPRGGHRSSSNGGGGGGGGGGGSSSLHRGSRNKRQRVGNGGHRRRKGGEGLSLSSSSNNSGGGGGGGGGGSSSTSSGASSSTTYCFRGSIGRVLCEVCGVYVNPGATAWQQHAEGVRHRRNSLGQGLSGRRRGHEYGEESSSASSSGTSSSSGSTARRGCAIDPVAECVRAVMASMASELPAHLAPGEPGYAKAAEQFSEAGLRRDWTRMAAELRGADAYWLLGGIGPITPGQLAALSWMILRRRRHELSLSVDLQADDAVSAATTAALCTFGDSLARAPHLRRLSLRVMPSRSWRSRLKACSTGQLLGRFHRVLDRLASAVGRNALLRELVVELPGPLVSEADGEALAAAVGRAPRDRRLALLMGTHRRAGAESPLRWMPPNVLQEVVERAIPRQPCAVVFRPLPLPGHDAGSVEPLAPRTTTGL